MSEYANIFSHCKFCCCSQLQPPLLDQLSLLDSLKLAVSLMVVVGTLWSSKSVWQILVTWPMEDGAVLFRESLMMMGLVTYLVSHIAVVSLNIF
jgi:hypothetical protein